MKLPIKRFGKAILAFAAAVIMMPSAFAAVQEYAVEGGTINFDTDTCMITGFNGTIREAFIPDKINGVEVRSIGDYAFNNCSQLMEVRLPDTLESIGYHAFAYCPELENITISDNVKIIESGAFWGCESLKSLEIPGSVSEIPESLCWNDSKLEKLTLSEGTKVIKNYAFNGCNQLESVTIPDSVTEIGIRAFGCKNLKTVTIGKNIKYLSKQAFYGCDSLMSAFFRSPAPPSCGRDPFRFPANGFTIYYMKEASDGWLSSTWRGYSVRPVPDAIAEKPRPLSGSVTALPSSSEVYVNGSLADLDAFNISGSSYFRLRDLAAALSGTKAQFNVSWDENRKAVVLTSLCAYTPQSDKLPAYDMSSQTAAPSNARILWNGKEIFITAYNISGNNYFKLRDIGQIFDFKVDWKNSQVSIDTSQPYLY